MGKLWGGRFGNKEMDPLVLRVTSSLDVDNVLAEYDCLSSKVQVEMLARCGYLTQDEKKALLDVLNKLSEEIESGEFTCGDHEDIHSALQEYVEGKVPEIAKKMHTGRSRNEQVVNDIRLYCTDSIDFVCELIEELQGELVLLAEKRL